MNRANHTAMPICTIALGLGFLLATALVNQPVHASHCVVSSATLLSTPVVVTQASHPTAKRQSVRLLQLARQAMRTGDLQRAEWHLHQAQELGVSYNGLLDRLSDTPEKVQKDLEQLKQAAGSQPAPPSQTFSPAVPGSRTFAQVGTSGPRASLIQNPYVGTPGASTDPLDELVGGARQQATKFLKQGRQALATGDTTAALGWYHSARNLGIAFGDGEYTPADPCSRTRPIRS